LIGIYCFIEGFGIKKLVIQLEKGSLLAKRRIFWLEGEYLAKRKIFWLNREYLVK